MKESTQVFTIMKYQKEVLNVFVYVYDSVFRTGKNNYCQVFL